MPVTASDSSSNVHGIGHRAALRRLATLFLAMLLSTTATSATDPARPAPKSQGLAGQFLVAAPEMPDPRFAHAVILMLEHDDEGALGLIVNKPLARETAGRLLRLLARLPPGEAEGPEIDIHYGGPVAPLQGFFLHSPDYQRADTKAITGRISVTRDLAILGDIADGKGPSRVFLALGYAGWAPGQLDGELQRKDWVSVPSDETLVFSDDVETVWQRAMDKRGIDL